jgi:hypothetical protein
MTTSCFGRPGAQHTVVPLEGEQGSVPLFEEDADKGLLTLHKSDKPGLQIRDLQGHWIIVDAELGPQDMVLYSGLSLYQATGGYLPPAVHRMDNNARQGQGSSPYGRCSIEFKLMPRATAILHCSAMTAAGHPVASPFQQPVAVHDFMQRSHPMDQLASRPGVPMLTFPTPSDGGSLPFSTCFQEEREDRGLGGWKKDWWCWTWGQLKLNLSNCHVLCKTA